MAFIIAADEIKKTLPGYDPGRSELFHRESARLADKELERALKVRPEARVIIMAGGAASGKTEYVSTYLKQQPAIVFDGTLPTSEGAKIKIKKAQKAGKRVEIHLILPASLGRAIFAFLNRERQFSVANFYRTHAGARQSGFEIAQNHPDTPVKIFISDIDSVTKKTMSFEALEFDSQTKLIEYLSNNQYTEADIRNRVKQQ